VAVIRRLERGPAAGRLRGLTNGAGSGPERADWGLRLPVDVRRVYGAGIASPALCRNQIFPVHLFLGSDLKKFKLFVINVFLDVFGNYLIDLIDLNSAAIHFFLQPYRNHSGRNPFMFAFCCNLSVLSQPYFIIGFLDLNF